MNSEAAQNSQAHLDPLYIDEFTRTVEQIRSLLEAAEPAMDQVAKALSALIERLKEVLSTLLSVGKVPEIDEFGMEREFLNTVRPLVDVFYEKWFRVTAKDIENVPSEGSGLLVANHSGTLPWDGAMVVESVRIDHPQQRDVRALVENFIFYFPFLGSIMARMGAVRACQENAERLLNKGELVAVFPEGVKGIGKLYRNRYQLKRFGRGGMIKLALRTGAPIIPVAVVGAEEILPMLSRGGWLARIVSLPYFPITPTFPWFGLLGLIPLPTKWTIRFGEPMDMQQYGPDAIRDRILINKLNEEVRQRVQTMINEELALRESVFFG